MNMTISRNGFLSPSRVDLFNEVSKELDHAINGIFGHDFFTGVSKKGKGYPLMDAVRTDKELILQYTVPGVDIDDLSVEITQETEGTLLSISGLLHDDYVFSSDKYQIRELSGQEFRRVIKLPKDIDYNNPKTSLKDGILTISFASISNNINKNNTKKIPIQKHNE
jgi:HSP20 family molecular chaperone IbpA